MEPVFLPSRRENHSSWIRDWIPTSFSLGKPPRPSKILCPHPDWSETRSSAYKTMTVLDSPRRPTENPGSLRQTTPTQTPDKILVTMEHPIAAHKKAGNTRLLSGSGPKGCKQATITLYLAVPNPCILQRLIPFTAEWFTCLDLKDAFFCFWVATVSQPLFAFKWENLYTESKKQLTWTRLPQAFKNSPTPFSRALATNLAKFPGLELNCVLLQYINDLLLASMTQAQCL